MTNSGLSQARRARCVNHASRLRRLSGLGGVDVCRQGLLRGLNNGLEGGRIVDGELGEIHHAQQWEEGGTTTVDNAVLLCWRHHQAVHQNSITIHHHAGGFIFTKPDGALLGVRRHHAVIVKVPGKEGEDTRQTKE